MPPRIDNENAKVFYGLHFYPGIAEYHEDGKESLRVFLNEDTIRKMNPTFAGCPIFVKHRDEITKDINLLRKEAEGWVVESFFNKADGKTWAKILVCTDNALDCIKKGYRLSNAYFPETFGPSGMWNGMEYDRQILTGEFEHLAIVDDPRYVESVILTPDEFKTYNLEKETELLKLSNSNNKGDKPMFEMFKRSKVENAADLENTLVKLPKSKKEMSISAALTELDKVLNMAGYASPEHMVKVNDKEEMSVNDMIKKYQDVCNELSDMKKAHEKEGDEIDRAENDDDDDEDKHENEDLDIDQMGERETGGDTSFENDDEEDEDKHENDDEEDDKHENDDDDEAKEKVDLEKKKNKKKNALEKKRLAREKALRLKMANELRRDEYLAPTPVLSSDRVQRGLQRYGSGK